MNRYQQHRLEMRTSIKRRQRGKTCAKVTADHEHVNNLFQAKFFVLDIVNDGHFAIAGAVLLKL